MLDVINKHEIDDYVDILVYYGGNNFTNKVPKIDISTKLFALKVSKIFARQPFLFDVDYEGNIVTRINNISSKKEFDDLISTFHTATKLNNGDLYVKMLDQIFAYDNVDIDKTRDSIMFNDTKEVSIQRVGK